MIDFDTIWSIYPRKVGKGAAEKSWEKAIKIAPPQKIHEAVTAFCAICKGKELEFIPHLATWLNQRRWEDEMTKPAEKAQRDSRAGFRPFKDDSDWTPATPEQLEERRRIFERIATSLGMIRDKRGRITTAARLRETTAKPRPKHWTETAGPDDPRWAALRKARKDSGMIR